MSYSHVGEPGAGQAAGGPYSEVTVNYRCAIRELFLSLMSLLLLSAPSDLLGNTSNASANTGKPGISNSLQMLVVTTRDWDDLHGTAQRYERSKRKELWHPVGPSFTVVVGKAGLGWGRGIQPDSKDTTDGPIKHKGDGKAPAGIFPLTVSFGYSPEPLSGTRTQYIALTPSVECVDDSQSSRYNKLFDSQGTKKDWNSSEKMKRDGELYRWGVFVAHNTDPAVGGAGSCIFLHVWHGPDSGTVGCTAMEQANIESLLRWLDPARHPVLVQLPAAQYAHYREAWSLPAPRSH